MAFTEAETLKSLNHRGIVKLYDCIPSKNLKVIFIMEYLEGGELYEYLSQRGKLPEDEARIFFKQMVEAMVYCHERKIIHRDLKLENVLLVKKGHHQIKIVDFGIAGLGSNMSAAKMNIGTLKYLPPEILKNKLKVSHPAQDVWALGVILFAMITGTLPFNGETEDEIMNNICNGRVGYTKEMESQVSFELKDLFTKIFNLDYLQRIKTIDMYYHPWTQGKRIDIKKEEERKVMFEDPKKDAKKGGAAKKGADLQVSTKLPKNGATNSGKASPVVLSATPKPVGARRSESQPRIQRPARAYDSVKEMGTQSRKPSPSRLPSQISLGARTAVPSPKGSPGRSTPTS
jgi:serine/threonine protein kinase